MEAEVLLTKSNISLRPAINNLNTSPCLQGQNLDSLHDKGGLKRIEKSKQSYLILWTKKELFIQIFSNIILRF